jgi:hypothetical protein
VLHRRAGDWAVPGHTLNEGTTLLLPGVNRRERTLEVYEVEDPVRDLEAGTWGIREPRPDRCDPADPRAAGFVLVPCVAFDRRGGLRGRLLRHVALGWRAAVCLAGRRRLRGPDR